MKKKALLILTVAAALILLTACGISEQATDKAAEKYAEEILGGSGAKVDIDGEKVTVTDDQGNSWSSGGTEWPTSELGSLLPKFDKGTITSVFDSDDSLIISLEEVKKEDIVAYIANVKGSFSKDAYNVNSEDGVSYGGTNEKGVSIAIMFGNDGATSISAYKNAE